MADQKDVKPEKRDDAPGKTTGLPAAGPHADPRLTNPDATPGTGILPPVGESDETNIQPTS